MKKIDPDEIRMVPVRVTFLEMRENPGIKPGTRTGTRFEKLSKPVTASHYRLLYYGVGEKYSWLDRMLIPETELEKQINRDNVDIFILTEGDSVAGYAEFVIENDFVEILYFGLMPGFIGRGLGGYFLQLVIQKAWSYGKPLVRLNTCELDHPHALPNYTKLGFQITRTSVEERKVLANLPGHT